LGLGFTLAELLRIPGTGRVIVAEIEDDLVAWHPRGLTPDTAWAVQDVRTEIRTADVRQVVLELGSETMDLVLLDLGNGPGYLVYQNNADLYRGDFPADRRVVRGGVRVRAAVQRRP
jgi:spermidine synthase